MRKYSAMILLFQFFIACSLAPPAQEPETEFTIPDEAVYYEEAEYVLSRDELFIDEWWKKFNDSLLNRIVDRIITNNLDIQVAQKNIDMLHIQLRGVESNLFPSASAHLGYSRGQQLQPSFSPTEGMTEEMDDFESFSTGIDISYLLDITGRVRLGRQAFTENIHARQAEVRNLYGSLIMQGIIQWYTYISAIERLELARDQYSYAVEQEEIQEMRYTAGLGSMLELEQAGNARYAAENRVRTVKQERDLAKINLSVLMGSYPGRLFTDDTPAVADITLPDVPAVLPSEHIKTRPDVVAALHAIEKARLEIGVARADFFPSLSLSASVSNRTENFSDLFSLSDFARSIGGQMAQTLFKGGEIRSNVSGKEAAYAQAILSYRNTVLTALKDVESALVRLHSTEENYTIVEGQYESLSSVYEEMRTRYMQGIVPYERYIDSRESLIEMDMARTQLFMGRISARLELIHSFGGLW
jgi:NodT family efflux transporter outer membrane factor (OMF) lipoprotein